MKMLITVEIGHGTPCLLAPFSRTPTLADFELGGKECSKNPNKVKQSYYYYFFYLIERKRPVNAVTWRGRACARVLPRWRAAGAVEIRPSESRRPPTESPHCVWRTEPLRSCWPSFELTESINFELSRQQTDGREGTKRAGGCERAMVLMEPVKERRKVGVEKITTSSSWRHESVTGCGLSKQDAPSQGTALQPFL